MKAGSEVGGNEEEDEVVCFGCLIRAIGISCLLSSLSKAACLLRNACAMK